jgi:cobalt/nickel transport protein
MRTRTFVLAGVVVALLVAGVASYFASTSPDGLEYVAEEAGFADTAEDSAATDSPLADYRVDGVENDAVSGGLAGVAGALVVLTLTGGLTYAVRRRGTGVARGEGSDSSREDAGRYEPAARRDRS